MRASIAKIGVLASLLIAAACLFGAAPKEKEKEKAKPQGPLAEARTRLLRGNLDEAIEIYTKLRGEEKHRVAATIGLARTLVEKGEVAKAATELTATLKLDGLAKNPDLLAEKANVLLASGQYRLFVFSLR